MSASACPTGSNNGTEFMRSTIHTALLMAILAGLHFVLLLPLCAQAGMQEAAPQRAADSLHMMELYGKGRELYDQGQPYQALNMLGEALQAAMKMKMERAESGILELIGDIYLDRDEGEEAIPYYLRVASLVEFAGDSAGLGDIYRKTGDAYSTAGVHEKALEYYRKSEGSMEGGNVRERMELKEKLGTESLLSGRAGEALEHFLRYEGMLEEQGELPVAAWTHLVNAYREMGNDTACLYYSRKLLDHYSETGNASGIAVLQNNMGFYYTMLARYREALEHYGNAVEQAETAGFPAGRIAVMMANMGVCFQNMNEPAEAKDQLNRALGRIKNSDFPAERSRIENLQALIYFNENDLYNAGFFCREAISSAEEAKDAALLADAYMTYSRVLRAGNDPVNALNYYESCLAIRDSLQLEQRLRQERQKQRISGLERSENDLLLRLREERVNELTINRLTLQLEREEQAREILMKENDMRLLEQEKLRQSLVITEQQHRVEQQERQNRILEQEQRIARMALEEEQRKQQEAEREIQLLEQQRRLDQLSLEKQKTQRKALIGIVALMVLVVALVTGSLLLARKKNMLLARQKQEIEEKNRDLEQMNEEISAQRDEIEAQRDEIEAQRDLLYNQKEAIEQYNAELMKSIEYAKRIQSSTLPDLEMLRGTVSDYFVFFRPRDVVSGDFYWMSGVEDVTVLVVADCTGHGVPGAFMSVMGMSLLKEIVQKEYLTHPGVVLRRMRKEIIRSLGQKGISGEQRDGMDISLIEINPGEKRIQYAGAFNSLYLVRKSDLKPPGIPDMQVMEGVNGFVLYDIPADRMPVAFYERMEKFTTRRFSIREGDQLYMFTDGYADQFGGENGKKFKYKPFKQLILDNAGLQMGLQQEVFTRTFDRWKGDFDQIDDICVIGLKF
jgi:serine phosphatase RsbU (regulator of sigma subunit)